MEIVVVKARNAGEAHDMFFEDPDLKIYDRQYMTQVAVGSWEVFEEIHSAVIASMDGSIWTFTDSDSLDLVMGVPSSNIDPNQLQSFSMAKSVVKMDDQQLVRFQQYLLGTFRTMYVKMHKDFTFTVGRYNGGKVTSIQHIRTAVKSYLAGFKANSIDDVQPKKRVSRIPVEVVVWQADNGSLVQRDGNMEVVWQSN